MRICIPSISIESEDLTTSMSCNASCNLLCTLFLELYNIHVPGLPLQHQQLWKDMPQSAV